MRQIIVTALMLLVGLGVTFGAANVLQSVAVARAPSSSEPFVIETAKSQHKPAAVKEQRVVISRSRDSVRTATLAGE